MFFKKEIYNDLEARAELSAFAQAEGTKEYHVMIHVEGKAETFEQQLHRLQQADSMIRQSNMLADAKVVFKRNFLSDATNQVPLIKDNDGCTISFIQQSPLDGSKLALWLYMVEGAEVEYNADRLGSTVVRHNGYEHVWTMGMMSTEGNSYDQTEALLEDYETLLDNKYGANIADHCIRTWFFVRDVDIKERLSYKVLFSSEDRHHFLFLHLMSL